MKLDYQNEIQSITAGLNKQNTAILATSLNDKVTIRSVSIVNDGLTVLFQTDARMTKIHQIRQNTNVALCAGTMNIEGIAQILGNARDLEPFLTLFREKHPGSYKMYTGMETEVVVSVKIERIKMWVYINEKSYEKVIDVAEEKVEMMEYTAE